MESAQREIAKLKVAYDDAKARETAAAGAAQRLAGQLLSADPNDVSGLESRIAAAGGDARNAGGDAGRIAGRAREVLAEFKREETKADGVLSGQRVPRGGGLAGGFAGPGLLPAPGVGDGLAPGFGVPLGGLSPFTGLVRVGDPWNSDIPGFGAYLDSQHSSAEPDNSLLNPVDLVSGGLAGLGRKTLATGASKLAKGAGRALGLTSEQVAIKQAEEKAFSETLTASGSNPVAKAGADAFHYTSRRAVQSAGGPEVQHAWRRSRSAVSVLGAAPVPEGDTAMTLADFRREMNQYWDSVNREALEMKDSYLALDRLHSLYRRFDADERALADEVLGEWVLSGSEGKRFDAMALIREFRVSRAVSSLQQLTDRLRQSADPGAPVAVQGVS